MGHLHKFLGQSKSTKISEFNNSLSWYFLADRWILKIVWQIGNKVNFYDLAICNYCLVLGLSEETRHDAHRFCLQWCCLLLSLCFYIHEGNPARWACSPHFAWSLCNDTESDFANGSCLCLKPQRLKAWEDARRKLQKSYLDTWKLDERSCCLYRSPRSIS